MPTLYTAQEAAEILRLEYETVLRYIRAGKLRAAKFGNRYRVREEDLEAFVEASMPPTDTEGEG